MTPLLVDPQVEVFAVCALLGAKTSQSRALFFAAAALTLLLVHISDATYSCCSEERRGTVCTLAGSGTANSIDSPNATTAAFYSPGAIVTYPPHGIIVGGYSENRLRIIHDNGHRQHTRWGRAPSVPMQARTLTATTLSQPGSGSLLACALPTTAAS